MQPEQKSFFQKYKKEIIITSSAVIVFGLLAYFLFFYNKQSNLNNIDSTANNNSGFNFGSLLNIFNIGSDNQNNSSIANNNDNNANYNYYNEGIIKIWSSPVAGYDFYYKYKPYSYEDEYGNTQTGKEKRAIIQFVDSNTGYIYEKDLMNPTSTPIQITDTLYPNIVRAYFINGASDNKSRVIMQYLSGNTIKTISAVIPEYYGSTGKLINIVNLPDNIKFFTVSKDNKKAAYIVLKNKASYGRQDTYTDWYLIKDNSDIYGSRIYSSDFSSWKLLIDDDKNIYAFTGDTAYTTNSLYKLENNTLSQIYSNHNGMSFLTAKDSLLVSIFTGNGLKIYKNNYFNGTNFTDSSIYPLQISTLANKCGENSKDGEELIICGVPKEIKNYESGLPDAWYQGLTSWDDNLYVINKDYPAGQMLFNLNSDGGISEKVDIKNVAIEDTKSHLAFINKNDGSLWTLNIGDILYQGD